VIEYVLVEGDGFLNKLFAFRELFALSAARARDDG
jgi:hypothetical protein